MQISSQGMQISSQGVQISSQCVQISSHCQQIPSQCQQISSNIFIKRHFIALRTLSGWSIFPSICHFTSHILPFFLSLQPMKIKIGIIFGGRSREREVSFAGGRTVYDNLNKSIFEPVPIFVDSFGNFVFLNWEHIYKGCLRDFYPPIDSVPITPHEFQIYAESLGNLNDEQQEELINKIGKRIRIENLLSHID